MIRDVGFVTYCNYFFLKNVVILESKICRVLFLRHLDDLLVYLVMFSENGFEPLISKKKKKRKKEKEQMQNSQECFFSPI